MLPLPYRPAQGRRDGSPTSPSSPGPDFYYSTRDIEILHHVVVAAQENLASLPKGERLATNALFGAYDQVLPLYGVDPEQDHHLSRLLFRIGGERGRESIFNKFRAVLSRMGIELQVEADGHTTSSKAFSDSASERHIAPPVSEQQHPPQMLAPTSRPEIDEAFIRHAPVTSVEDHLDYPTSTVEERDPSKVTRLSRASQGDVAIPSAVQDRPREHVDTSSGRAMNISAMQDTVPAHRLDEPHPSHRQGRSNEPPSETSGQRAHHEQPTTVTTAVAASPALKHTDNLPYETLVSRQLPVRQSTVPEPEAPPLGHSQRELDRLETRASRAWGLFQMTKAVSHWYIWTEEKSNRQSVAKRHMTRFRHFGPWHDEAAHAKQYSKNLLVSRACKFWEQNAQAAFDERQAAVHHAATLTLHDGLDRWTMFLKSRIPVAPQLLRRTRLQIQSPQWADYTSVLQQHQRRAQNAASVVLTCNIITTWHGAAATLGNCARDLNRQMTYNRALSLWQLTSKACAFRQKLSEVNLQAILSRWHSLSQACLSVEHHTFQDQRGTEVSIRRLDRPRTLTAIHRRCLLARVVKTWRLDAVDAATEAHAANTFSFVADSRHGLSAWYGLANSMGELRLWGLRAQRYLMITTTLNQARRLSRPSWSHTTRTRYARARWKQKYLNARDIVSAWMGQSRASIRLHQAAHSREIDISAHRLILTLHAWQEECQGLWTLDWSSHVPNSWLNEWAVSQESLRLLHDEASAAWQSLLKTRVYNRWRTVSVQFLSQTYVVADVFEKNSRKSTRRLLLHWDSSIRSLVPLSLPHRRPAVSSSQAPTSRGPGSSLWSNRQLGTTTASSLIGLGDRDWPDRVDEEQHGDSLILEAEDDQGPLNTPTKWTGMGASMIRLPTTTPLAPLSTPFERELRGRYKDTHGASTLNMAERLSVRGTPRLSTNEARLIAERRRKRPV